MMAEINRSWRQKILLGCALGLCAMAGLARAAAPELVPKAYDVRGYGALGDGRNDDTAAFQKALDEANAAGGSVVSVPAGQYLVKSHLTIPENVTLEGIWRAPAASIHLPPAGAMPTTAPLAMHGSLYGGSVLLAVEGAGKTEGTPFITLKSNATIKGLTVFYPEQKVANPPVAYPWTVAGAGDNCSVVDMLLINPYQALNFGARPCGRHFIRNVNAQAIYRGLFIDQCYDIGRVENVHFWPFWGPDLNSPLCQFTKAKGEAFVIGRTDWEYISNSFSIAYQVGMRFVKSPGDPKVGAGNVLLTQTGSDMAPNAIIVEDCQSHAGLVFTNANMFGQIKIAPTNTGPVKFTNCCFFGTVMPEQEDEIMIDGQNRVSFDNCHFFELDPGNNKARRVIHAIGGRLGLSNCQFLNTGERQQVVLEPAVKTAVIMGNDFAGALRLDNRAQGQVQVGLNVSDQPSSGTQTRQ